MNNFDLPSNEKKLILLCIKNFSFIKLFFSNSTIIPSILLNKSKVIKGENFRNHKENGDAVSMVKIYNAQMADEILVLDIKLRDKRDKINFELLKKISKNCFIPLCYGGGLDNENEVFKVLQSGFEKVFINNSAFKNTIFIKKLISIFGGQAIVVGVDYGYENQTPRVFINSGKKRTEEHPLKYIKELQEIGVGEIILTTPAHLETAGMQLNKNAMEQWYDPQKGRYVAAIKDIAKEFGGEVKYKK